MVVGLGIDLAEVARVAAAWRRHGDRFLARVLTDAERRDLSARRHPEEHMAGRFAAKEAVLKALGTGWGGGLGFRHVEVRGGGGPPEAILHGPARARATALGGNRTFLSISHAGGFAVATAVLTA